MAGLGVNIVTGMLAFIGQPENYIYSVVFWLKMLSLVLLGLNAAVFYLTDIFDGSREAGGRGRRAHVRQARRGELTVLVVRSDYVGPLHPALG